MKNRMNKQRLYKLCLRRLFSSVDERQVVGLAKDLENSLVQDLSSTSRIKASNAEMLVAFDSRVKNTGQVLNYLRDK
jgi:hypothetical protein